ncbi:hypothetical protein BKP45_10380 [Anaerobacillus alkalidiazotrophicus]|uniref:UPF0398 protein BKP45_10380 n=1 Tax=Anaerobacillus alkalidiazotrophicus TaxID=472963 RepID=A0A1S2M6E6_9BACI|nr:DUF1273 domain-containing protein [Anaerobacillus alkalidiazotrophicus]OIJ20073.1 hypothetical protein BKP45_10380 [Anaerobacillus alkalidiazotrophicus]
MVKVLAVTGYKAHELGVFDEKHKGITYIKKVLEKRLVSFIEDGLEWVIISGQLGVELWCGEVVINLKKQYPNIKLAVLTPYYNQEENWNDARKEQYQNVLQRADYVDSITKRNYENPSQLKLKNQFIVEKSDALLVIFDDDKPGSPSYYITYAKARSEKSNYEIFYIFPDEIELAYQDDLEQW